jgi:hypothetical protein
MDVHNIGPGHAYMGLEYHLPFLATIVFYLTYKFAYKSIQTCLGHGCTVNVTRQCCYPSLSALPTLTSFQQGRPLFMSWLLFGWLLSAVTPVDLCCAAALVAGAPPYPLWTCAWAVGGCLTKVFVMRWYNACAHASRCTTLASLLAQEMASWRVQRNTLLNQSIGMHVLR